MADHEQPEDGTGEGLIAPEPGGRDQPPTGPRPGSMRTQSAETSTPRPPTVAEARQRDKARKAREAAEELAAAQELRRAARKRKALMGSVAVVGVAGAIALTYLAFSGADDDRGGEVSATCVKDGTDEVVPEEYCSAGTGGVGGVFIWAGTPYRYYYGGANGGVGTVAQGGTLELPKDTVGRTKSGSTITRSGKGSGVSITRGGLGSGSNSSVGG